MMIRERAVSLRELATQNHYAARVIQALIRGHLCRRELWSYEGILTIAAITKIQKIWRGYYGRRLAAQRYLDFIRQKREIIRGLCRCWKARRVLRIKRAEFLNKTATILQCAYRSRASRKYFQELKRKALERMATRLQKTIRGFICRRWVYRLWNLVGITLVDLKRLIHEDIVVANSISHRMTLQSYTLSDLQNMRPDLKRSCTTSSSNSSSAHTTPATSRPNSANQHSLALTYHNIELPPPWGPNNDLWRQFHLALAQLVGTNRPIFAIDLLNVLLNRDPTFLPAIFVLVCAYLFAWCSGGTTGARLVREDFLEEALGIMIRLQELQKRQMKNMKTETSILNSDLIELYGEETRESNFLFLLEKTYFWNSFRTGGCNARTLSLMSSIVLGGHFLEFGTGFNAFMTGYDAGIGRAKRLIDRVRDCSAYREAEAVSLRTQMLENLFESAHESVFKQRVGMRDLLEDVEEIEGVSRVVSVDIECFRAGEMLLVTGKVGLSRGQKRDIPDSMSKIELVREKNKLKWTLPGNESVLQIRPYILLPPEVEQIYSASVAYFTRTTGKPEQEIQMRPKWRTLSEYVTQGIRLVSCGRGRYLETAPSLYLVSGVRLVLPSIEYRRQERNSLRTEAHCARLIQRAFRGFQGRSLWRRLHLRILEEKRQRSELGKVLEASSKLRAARYFQISLIQARVKGWIHRRKLNIMKLAALRIQCLARCRQARLRVHRERVRRSLGPEVIEMLRRVVCVSGHTLSIVVYRCGGSYKIVGYDGVQSRKYIGYVYEPEVNSILAEYNKRFEGDTKAVQLAKVMPWQHNRLIEVLLENMSVSAPITSLTRELGGSKSNCELIFIPKKNLTEKGIDSKPSRRILVDEAMIVKKYDEIMAIKEEREQKEKRKKNRLKYL